MELSYSAYTVHLVRRDCAPDTMLTAPMAVSEQRLWNELRDLHLRLADSSLRTEAPSINHAYFELLDRRLVQTEAAALELAKGDLPYTKKDKLLHAYRRQLSILYQEQELLTTTTAQSHAIGRDGAFTACGRRYAKMRRASY